MCNLEQFLQIQSKLLRPYTTVLCLLKQKIAIHMRMCISGHQTMMKETSKTINFWGRFVYNMVIHMYIG